MIELEPQPLPDLGPWLEVKLVASADINGPLSPKERQTLKYLGLSSRNTTVWHRDLPATRGLLNFVTIFPLLCFLLAIAAPALAFF